MARRPPIISSPDAAALALMVDDKMQEPDYAPKKPKPGFMIFHDQIAMASTLSDDELGKLIRAAAEYSSTGALPDNLPTRADAVFPFFKASIDRDGAKYLEKCRQAHGAIKKRWE